MKIKYLKKLWIGAFAFLALTTGAHIAAEDKDEKDKLAFVTNAKLPLSKDLELGLQFNGEKKVFIGGDSADSADSTVTVKFNLNLVNLYKVMDDYKDAHDVLWGAVKNCGGEAKDAMMPKLTVKFESGDFSAEGGLGKNDTIDKRCLFVNGKYQFAPEGLDIRLGLSYTNTEVDKLDNVYGMFGVGYNGASITFSGGKGADRYLERVCGDVKFKGWNSVDNILKKAGFSFSPCEEIDDKFSFDISSYLEFVSPDCGCDDSEVEKPKLCLSFKREGKVNTFEFGPSFKLRFRAVTLEVKYPLTYVSGKTDEDDNGGDWKKLSLKTEFTASLLSEESKS